MSDCQDSISSQFVANHEMKIRQHVPLSLSVTLNKLKTLFGRVHCNHSDSLTAPLPWDSALLQAPTASDTESDVSVTVMIGSGTASGGLEEPTMHRCDHKCSVQILPVVKRPDFVT